MTNKTTDVSRIFQKYKDITIQYYQQSLLYYTTYVSGKDIAWVQDAIRRYDYNYKKLTEKMKNVNQDSQENEINNIVKSYYTKFLELLNQLKESINEQKRGRLHLRK